MTGQIRLLSTDFDGTLISHPSDGRCGPELAECLAEFRAGGGRWAVNTGRSLEHIIEGIEIFAAPVQPDFLLTNEREVFLPDGAGGWVGLDPWNRVCYERHAKLFHGSGPILESILSRVEASPDVTVIREEAIPVGLITSDERAMEVVATRMEEVRREFPEFGYQRNTIYLRFCHVDYHKGSALAALTQHLGLRAENVFAAGDHFNDLPMLDPHYAGVVACPVNAIPEVKERVMASGGVVADLPSGAGTAAALRSRAL